MLEDTLKEFIVRMSSSISLEDDAEVVAYLSKLDTGRMELLGTLREGVAQRSRIGGLQIDVPALFATASLFIGVGTALQKILIRKLKVRGMEGKLNQVDSFAVVDIWGEIEASKALLFSLDRRLDDEHEKAGSFRADAQVLLESVKSSLVDVLKQLGNVDTFSRYTTILDWLIGLSRGPEFEPLSDSIRAEIVEIAA